MSVYVVSLGQSPFTYPQNYSKYIHQHRDASTAQNLKIVSDNLQRISIAVTTLHRYFMSVSKF